MPDRTPGHTPPILHACGHTLSYDTLSAHNESPILVNQQLATMRCQYCDPRNAQLLTDPTAISALGRFP